VTRRLLEATRSRRVVAMRYFSASNNRAKQYEVHPYRLALATGGVYVVAWVPAYEEFRTFAASRIERLTGPGGHVPAEPRAAAESVLSIDGRVLG
jgi:predicted DNA-binding transcriptional regulator YafY